MTDIGISAGGGRGTQGDGLSAGNGASGGPSLDSLYGPEGQVQIDQFIGFGSTNMAGVLGIPDPGSTGFQAQQTADGRTFYFRPSGALAYMEGDATQQVTRMSETELKKIQQVMASSGLISGSVQYGMPDSKTINAYEQVLMMSNRLDVSPMVVLGRLGSSARDMMLAEMEAAARQQAASGPTRAPFVAQVANQEDLRRSFQDAVVERLGSMPEGLDLDALADAYQTVQRNAQASAYNAAPSGGTVEQAVSPQSFIEGQMEAQAPQQMQSNDVVERAGQLFDMLGNFGGM